MKIKLYTMGRVNISTYICIAMIGYKLRIILPNHAQVTVVISIITICRNIRIINIVIRVMVRRNHVVTGQIGLRHDIVWLVIGKCCIVMIVEDLLTLKSVIGRMRIHLVMGEIVEII